MTQQTNGIQGVFFDMNLKKLRLTGAVLASLIALSFPAAARAAGLESFAASQADLTYVSVAMQNIQEGNKILPPEDLFIEMKACRVIDASLFRQPSIEESTKLLQPCMDAISKRYALTLRAYAGSVNIEPQSVGTASGVQLRIEAVSSSTDSRFLRDINYALATRQGKIFGYPARLTNR